MQVEYRTALAEVRGDDLEYVISDMTQDRHGTVLSPDAWNLSNFRKNPIALFNHNPNFIVGNWEKVRAEGDRLIGRLKLLPKGVSYRLDEIRAAVEAGVLRAVSVGFLPRGPESDRLSKMELLEVSLVSVPSNPNALAIVRSLNISEDVQSFIFGEPANEDDALRLRFIGESAENPSLSRKKTMTLSERIEAAQSRLSELRSEKELHVVNAGDDMDDEALATLESLNTQIERQQRTVNALVGAEQASARTAEPAIRSASTALTISGQRPFAAPAQKIKSADLMIRSFAVGLLSHVTRRPPEQIIAERYENHPDTRAVFDYTRGIDQHTRAASAPATTTTSGWASQLVQTVTADFLETIVPNAIYPRLAALGQRYTFGRSGTVSIPTWDSTPTIAGGFVLEGAAIPVKQGALSSQTLTPKKMAVITTFTREIAEYSNPALEGLLRQKIQNDTSVALDTVLLDATAVSTTRPAGLRNGVSETTATAGGGFAALIGDIAAHIAAVAQSGTLTAPVILLNPANAVAIGMTQNAGGDFPFGNVGLTGGNINGIPVLVSSTVTADMMITVDAAWFATATGDEPRFDVSDQATLHMEDTSPVAIGTAGTPNVVAAPVRSLFQTDSLALRMILPMNWIKVRTPSVAWSSSVTW
jgi:HK97 family phage major capsid protein/HK97 family phage prohead protease